MQRALVGVLWVAFAALALAVRGAGESGLPGDRPLLDALTGLGEGVRSAGTLVSGLTGLIAWPLLVLVLCGVLWWRGRGGAALVLLATQIAADLVSLALKAVVDRPRPVDAALGDVVATASFPSSHAVRITVTLGFLLLAFAWRRPEWRAPSCIAAAAFVLLVGAARLTTGEHWPSDVFGGVLLGAAWIGTLWLVRTVRDRVRA